MWATLTDLASPSQIVLIALIVRPAARLLTVGFICVAIVGGLYVCLRGTAPTERPAVLRDYVGVARALRDLSYVWRKR